MFLVLSRGSTPNLNNASSTSVGKLAKGGTGIGNAGSFTIGFVLFMTCSFGL